MKKFGILMALFMLSCNLFGTPVFAEPVHLPQIENNTYSSQQYEYPQSFVYNCIFLNRYLRIFKDIQQKNGYVWLNAYKTNVITGNNVDLWRAKVDCRNQLIGIKKSYAGNYEYIKSFKTPVLTDFDVKMQDINKNNDYKSIYDYVCKY